MNKFLKEIFEQPAALSQTLDYYIKGEGQSKLEQISALWKSGNFNSILFTGMGSSFFAPYTATCMLSNNGITSANINAGELLHYHLPLLKGKSLLTCVSQSGESYEVVKILEKLPEGQPFVGITNESGSTLARLSEVALLSTAGKEEMTSTKTYVSTLLVLSIYCRALTGKWKKGKMPELNSAIGSLNDTIEKRNEWLSGAMELLGHPSFVQIIGRGPAYSSVLQGSLMVMEAARNPAAGMLGGEFRHGPLEMSKKGFRAIILAPLGTTYNQSVKLAGDITRFGGKVLFITNSQQYFNNSNILAINISCEDEYLFPVAAIVPLQFIVNQWAVDAGHEPGNFIMGAKVTTTE